MALAIYMDHHVPKAITNGLRLRGVDVLTAYEDGTHEYEDGTHEYEDDDLLDRATKLKRVLFSQDDDLLAEAAKRIENNVPFYGVIYAHQLRVSIGVCVNDLEIIARAGEAEDITGKLVFSKTSDYEVNPLPPSIIPYAF